MKNNQNKSSRGGSRKGAGRKAGTPNKSTKEVKELASKHGPEVIKELVRLAKNAQGEAARIAAGREVLDRAYGKAPQAMEVTGTLIIETVNYADKPTK